MSATWHADDAALDRYRDGSISRADAASVEAHVLACTECRTRLQQRADGARLERNFEFVLAEIGAPRRHLLERLVVRLGVPEHAARLMGATPALRWSFFLAVLIALTFAGSAVADSAARGTDRLETFLVIAPLVPVLGVALCYGPGVDPTHEIAVAAPIDKFRLLMLRSVTVLVVSIAIDGFGALTQPVVGLASAAWLVPALGLSAATLALSSVVSGRLAAGAVAGAWVLATMLVDRFADDPLAPFGVGGQVALALVAVGAAAVLVARRRRFAVLGATA